MDIKRKSNNELLALMLTSKEESDTYKLAYTEFANRFDGSLNCDFSSNESGSIPVLNNLIDDLVRGEEIDSEYWNDHNNMNISEWQVGRFERLFSRNEPQNSFAR